MELIHTTSNLDDDYFTRGMQLSVPDPFVIDKKRPLLAVKHSKLHEMAIVAITMLIVVPASRADSFAGNA